MAKVKSKKKAESQNADTARLLIQIQTRVESVVTDANRALTRLQDEAARAWELGNSREAVASKNRDEFVKFAKYTTDSLYALRDSAQKAFTKVAEDFQSLNTSVQKLNERLSRTESLHDALRSETVFAASNSISRRLDILEERSQNSDNIDKYVSERINVALASVRAMLQPKIMGNDGKPFEYIHPLDLEEVVTKGKGILSNGMRTGIVEVDGVRYKQSPDVPRRPSYKFS